VTGWDWLAVVAAAVAIPLAVVYAVQGSLAEAYQKGYRKGHAEGFEAGVFEATRTVRTHSTQRAAKAERQGEDPGRKGRKKRPG